MRIWGAGSGAGHEKRVCTFEHLMLGLCSEPSSGLEGSQTTPSLLIPGSFSSQEGLDRAWRCRVTSAHGDSACVQAVPVGCPWINLEEWKIPQIPATPLKAAEAGEQSWRFHFFSNELVNYFAGFNCCSSVSVLSEPSCSSNKSPFSA